MHFHLPSYLPYYPEPDSEEGKMNETEVELIDSYFPSSILSATVVFVAVTGLIFMISLFVS